MPTNLTFSKAQLVGIPNGQNWSQSFIFETENADQKEKIGNLFGILTVKTSAEKEATVVGKEILAKLEASYQNATLNSLDSLKTFLKNEETAYGTDCFSATLGLLKEKLLYLAVTSGQKIILTRNGKHTIFFQENQGNLSLRSASGYLEAGDTLIFKTPEFTQVINDDRLMELLSSENISETVEKIAPEIHSLEDSSLVAALFLKFTLQVLLPEDVEEITIEEVPTKKPVIPEEPSLSKESFPQNLIQKIKSMRPPGRALWAEPNFNQKNPLPFLRSEKVKENKPLKLIALIIFLLLVGTISVSYFSQKNQVAEKNYQEKIAVIEKSIKEGTSLSDVNANKAKDILIIGQKTLAELLKKYAKDVKKTAELKNLKTKLNEALNSAIRIYKVTPGVFYDLTIIKNKAVGSNLSIFEDNLAILDNVNNSVYILSLKNKSGEIVGGGKETSGVKFLTLYGTNTYLLNPDKNILQVDNEVKKTKTLITKDNWRNILSFSSFAGNLYLLDQKNNQIWKYIKTDNGFSAVKNYLTEDTTLDFSDALSMAIDGSVYLLKKDGLIQKFTQGSVDNFNISGLDTGLGSEAQIFTNDEVKNIYLLDKTNKRIVVLGKNGVYDGQYLTDLVSKATSFTVSETLKKIFLLVGDKIYSLDLK